MKKKLADTYENEKMALIFDKMAYSFLYMKHFSEAIMFSEWAITLLNGLPRPHSDYTFVQMGRALVVLGASLVEKDKYVDGRSYLQEALKISIQMSRTCFGLEKSIIEKEIAKSFIKENNSEYAVEISRTIENFVLNHFAFNSSKKHFYKNFGTDLHEIGKFLYKEHKFPEAHLYFKSSFHLFKKLSKDIEADANIADTLQSMGDCSFAMKNFKTAQKEFGLSLSIRTQMVSATSDSNKVTGDN